MTTATPVQAEQTQQKPVFSHRLDTTQAHDLLTVVDAVGLMTERAKSILYLLFGQFQEGANRYNDEILQGAVSAAIAEINDIEAAIFAHHDAVKNGGKA